MSLWLPRARQEDVADAKANEAPPQMTTTHKLRILLVDDDSLVNMNTAYLLMDLGHSVLEADSASRALKILENDSQFDVVITDFAMPGMNGLDLATKIRERKPRLPIILATGFADIPAHVEISLPHLSKPFSQEALAEALRSALKMQ